MIIHWRGIEHAFSNDGKKLRKWLQSKLKATNAFAWLEVARRLKGGYRFQIDQATGQPVVNCKLEGCPVVLTTESQRVGSLSKYLTLKATVQLPSDSGFWAHLWDGDPGRDLKDMVDVGILKRIDLPKSDWFSTDYNIIGSDPDRIRSFLSPVCRTAISSIRMPRLLYSGETLILQGLFNFTSNQNPHWKTNFEYLGDVANAIMKFVERLGLIIESLLKVTGRDEDIAMEYVDDWKPEDWMCPVCGSTLEDKPLVTCKWCRTPHHDDCWGFFGGCATFGCGGTSKESIQELADQE